VMSATREVRQTGTKPPLDRSSFSRQRFGLGSVVDSAEPQRLLEAREYRAAVISAMALLEVRLRELLNRVPWPQTRRPMSMSSPLDQAVEQGLIPQQLRPRVEEWTRTRNLAVHSSMPIPRAEAREIVRGVLELIAQMQPK
jgi:hypothetical protein